ncbi:NAD(P)H-dependent oxidoreductase [Streptococcus dysgalactiae]|uniref:NAD(P)H-dependent oxidoreductase n=1 Tax=Streptococcus dysgalactiae TaxID=1334 RepID=UPI000806FC90|nr:NAD(P)H-dependent oxidoreductase [Streptococcus dysgalactiae]OBY98997.1 NAD(P)H dehydrogenase [Streptococcus dysgalactiae subsp. equisimilis]
MANILIVTGHTYPDLSVGNKEIERLLKENYPDAQVSNLIELYPDFQIDVKAEQEKLLWADVIIIQSPLFWYSMSSLVMRWLEEVFEHGWAYGSKGHALDNKKVILGLTAGSTNEDYAVGGKMGISVQEILKTLEITFDFCRMNLLGSVFTGGMFNTGNATTEQEEELKKLAQQHVNQLISLLD